MADYPTYRILKETIVHGPYSQEQLDALIKKGKLHLTDMVSINGGPWKPLAELLRDMPSTESSTNATLRPTKNILTPNQQLVLHHNNRNQTDSDQQNSKTKSPNQSTDEVDFSREPDFNDFIKKRQIFTIFSFIEFFCCFLQPKFAVGDIQGGLVRMIINIPLSCVCFAGFIIRIMEIIKLTKMTDNQFYANFKINKKLFNI